MSVRHSMREYDPHKVGPSSARECSPRNEREISSPYTGNPISLADYRGYVSSPRYDLKLTSKPANIRIIPPSFSNRKNELQSPRRNLLSMDENSYVKRTEMLKESENKYYSILSQKYVNDTRQTPYNENHLKSRNRSLRIIHEKNQKRQQFELKQRNKELAEHELALKKAKRTDLFHKDEIINPRNRFLRIIPTYDRSSPNYDPSSYL